MRGFIESALDLGLRVRDQTRLLLGGLGLAGLPLVLSLVGLDIAVGGYLATVIIIFVLLIAAVRAHGATLAELKAATPAVSLDCIRTLGQFLTQANVLIGESVRSDDQYLNWKVRVEDWVRSVEATLHSCVGREDADLFQDIAGRQSSRFPARYDNRHGTVLNNLTNWKDNLADLIKVYKGYQG